MTKAKKSVIIQIEGVLVAFTITNHNTLYS
jgi:hypothetical protein